MPRSAFRLVRGGVVCSAVALLAAIPVQADLQQAVAYLKSAKYLEAASELQAIVDRVPSYHYGHYLLGHCHLKTGYPIEAERSFARALALESRRAEYYHGLATAYKELRQYGRVLEVVARGVPLARDPQWVFAFLWLRAGAEVALHRWAEAAGTMERALEIRRDSRVLRDLGRVYLALGRNHEAVGALTECMLAEPGEMDTYELLVEAMLRRAASAPEPRVKRSLYLEAFHVAQGLEAALPADPGAANLLGRAALGAGRHDVAEAAFRRVLAVDPTHCYAMVNLASVQIARSRWDDAERILFDAARCGPNIGETFVRLGYVHLRRDRIAEAEQAFRRASVLLPPGVVQRVFAELSRWPSDPAFAWTGPEEDRRRGSAPFRLGGKDPEVRVLYPAPGPEKD